MNTNAYPLTILLVNYKPSWEELSLTLASIFAQDYKDFEIVVADDGSDEPFDLQMKEVFASNRFTNYTFVLNEKNQGTVKNILSGLYVSKGKHVIDISAGDLLYHQTTLRNVLSFMEKTDCHAAFGLLKAYHRNQDGDFSFARFDHPFDITSYRKQKQNNILRNLILYSDHACGASMIFKREFLHALLSEIEDVVIYEEDIMQVLAALQGKPFCLFDEYFVYYEKNVGVSATKESPFAKLLAKDVENFYQLMLQKYPHQKFLIKRDKLLGFYKIENLYLRSFLRISKNPHLILYMLNHIWQVITNQNLPKRTEVGFLEDTRFLDS